MRYSLLHWWPQYFTLLSIHALCHVTLKLISPKGQGLSPYALNPAWTYGLLWPIKHRGEMLCHPGLSLQKPCVFLLTLLLSVITMTKSSGPPVGGWEACGSELSHSSHSHPRSDYPLIHEQAQPRSAEPPAEPRSLRINHCFSIPLSFKVVCYTAKDNWYAIYCGNKKVKLVKLPTFTLQFGIILTYSRTVVCLMLSAMTGLYPSPLFTCLIYLASE